VAFEFSMHVNAQMLACTQKSYLQDIKLTLLPKEKFIQVTEDKTYYKKERAGGKDLVLRQLQS